MGSQNFATSCEEKIRETSLPAALVALGIGLVLARLPLGAIVGTLLKIAFAAGRPILVILGIAKAGELLRSRV